MARRFARPPVRGARLAACITLLAAAQTSFGVARAERPTPSALATAPSSQATAQALFDEARALLAAERYAEACPKLAESLLLDPAPGTEINLGHCYEKNGELASAWAAFKHAAAEAMRSGRTEWALRAERRAELVAPRVPKVTVRVAQDPPPPGLELRCDGILLTPTTWGAPLPLDPGHHTIEAVAPSHKRWAREFDARPGEHVLLDVPALEPIAASGRPDVSPAPDTLPPASRSTAQRTAGVALLAAGTVGAVAGLAIGTWAVARNRDVEARCPVVTRCTDHGAVELSQRVTTAASASTITLIASGALLGGGALLYFTAPKVAPVRASAAIAPGGLAIGVSGDF